ncbi:MAG: TIGR03790 family protein [Acidobacteriia bacterium]|nr:TIGR03790 family protein [Terriglobia bacterium]
MRAAMGQMLGVLILAQQILAAQGVANVLLVVNDASPLSRDIGQYYASRRGVPPRNICHIRTVETEGIERSKYDREIAGAVGTCLTHNNLTEQVLYIVTTGGIPLKIGGSSGMGGDYAAVDSELTLLYSDLKLGKPHPIAGPALNPYFGKREAKFTHPEFPMYLVTRLQSYDLEGVKAIIDRGMHAVNQGKFVIDTESPDLKEGDSWLRQAAKLLPKDRVIFDGSYNVIYDQTEVIGYAGWGSNDHQRHRRFLGFQWLSGAIATEFVSTNGRTFQKPPDGWNISDWKSPHLWFAGSPQTLTADYLLEGATAATGHVDEPYLAMTPHPEYLLPAYYSGRNLAESYYMSIRALSWQNIMIGDPLCSLGPPGR